MTDLTNIPDSALEAEYRQRQKAKKEAADKVRYERYRAEVARITDVLRDKIKEALDLVVPPTDDELGDILCAVREYEDNHP